MNSERFLQAEASDRSAPSPHKSVVIAFASQKRSLRNEPLHFILNRSLFDVSFSSANFVFLFKH